MTKRILQLALVFGLIVGCTNEDDLELNTFTQESEQEAKLPDIESGGFEEQKQIVLGKKIEHNPYSLESMQKAYDYYNQFKNSSSKTASRNATTKLKPTHYYIKINPRDETHLQVLDSLDNMEVEEAIVIHDYPLDYEIEEEGDFYVNPKSETDLYYPAYAVIPVGYKFYAELPFEKQTDLYKPNEEEDDIESISIILNGSEEQILEEFGILFTIDDLPTLLSMEEDNPEHQKLFGGWFNNWFGRRYRPHGWVKVQNTETNKFEPLKKAKISIGRSFWWRYTYTDNNGYFRSPKKYRGKVRIRAKWRGYTATIRKSCNELLGFWVSDHLMTITRGSNGRTKHINSWERHLWYKGTVHNGLRKYNDYAIARGIYLPVSYANVWVWENGKNAGSNPMLYRYRRLPTLATIAGVSQWNFWGALSSGVIGLTPSWLRPDQIYSGLKNRRVGSRVNTARIEQLVFHESTHYSHARRAGSWYWANLFAAEIGNQIRYGTPYYNGTKPTTRAAQQIALGEGFATFIEYKAINHYYGKAWDRGFWQNNPTTYMENFDMYTTPMTLNRTDNDSWFLTGLLWDITDISTESIAKRKNGQNNQTLNSIIDNYYIGSSTSFLSLYYRLSSRVYTGYDLKRSLLSSYPSQSNQINQLFNSYGY